MTQVQRLWWPCTSAPCLCSYCWMVSNVSFSSEREIGCDMWWEAGILSLEVGRGCSVEKCQIWPCRSTPLALALPMIPIFQHGDMTVWQVKWTVDLNWLLFSLCVWIHLGFKYLMLMERLTAGTHRQDVYFFIDIGFIDGLFRQDSEQLPTDILLSVPPSIFLEYIQNILWFFFFFFTHFFAFFTPKKEDFNEDPRQVFSHHSSLTHFTSV